MCWLQQSAQLWHYPTFLLPPLLLVAFVECFAGYHAWRFLLGFNGALLGFVAGAMLCMMLGVPMFVLLGALAGAVGGGALFAGIVPLGTFVFAFGSTASLTMLLGRMAGIPSFCYMPFAAVAGLAVTIAALAARRPAMIALAAIAGAQQIAGAWRAYCLPSDLIPLPDVVVPSEWTVFLALAAAGLVIQFATSRQPIRESAS